MMAKFATFAKYAIFLKIVALKGKPLHIKFRQFFASGAIFAITPITPITQLMKYIILGKFGELNLTFSKK